MAKPEKNRAQLEAEIEYLKRGSLAESFATVGSALVRWGALAFIFWCMSGAIKALAGEQTFAKIAVAFCADISADRWVAYVLAGAGTIYGRRERGLRKRNIPRLHKRIEDLEITIDENRSSSELTEHGDTRPEDER